MESQIEAKPLLKNFPLRAKNTSPYFGEGDKGNGLKESSREAKPPNMLKGCFREAKPL